MPEPPRCQTSALSRRSTDDDLAGPHDRARTPAPTARGRRPAVRRPHSGSRSRSDAPRSACSSPSGICLSLLNHVLTEVGLYRAIEDGGEISRKQFAMGSLGRLALVTLIAFVDRADVLALRRGGASSGLALMHLIMLVFTGLPLLNEMRKA